MPEHVPPKEGSFLGIGNIKIRRPERMQQPCAKWHEHAIIPSTELKSKIAIYTIGLLRRL